MATAKHIVVAEVAWRGYQKAPMKLKTPQATSETKQQYPIADRELQQAWARTAMAEMSLRADLQMLPQLSVQLRCGSDNRAVEQFRRRR
jgi:hypothetical protein